MKFKGIRFTLARKVVELPREMFKDAHNFQYIRFGRWVPEGTKGAVRTNYTYIDRFSDTRKPVWAVPVEIEGWSLTNMAYGSDGQMYLKFDGTCFTAPRRHRHSRYSPEDMTRILWRKEGTNWSGWKVEFAVRRKDFLVTMEDEMMEKARNAVEDHLHSLFPGATIKVHKAMRRRVERPSGTKEFDKTELAKQIIHDLCWGRGERLLDI